MGDEYDDEQFELAKAAYQAYGEATDFKNYQGLPMPHWDQLGDAIQGAWIAAANEVAEILSGGTAEDE